MDSNKHPFDALAGTKDKVSPENAIWVAKNKREYRVSEMDTTHIKNALAMLKRQGFVSSSTVNFYLNCPLPRGDMAMDAFDMEFDRLMERPVSSFIDIFEAELKRRGEE